MVGSVLMFIRNLCWLIVCGFALGSCTTETVNKKELRTGFRAAPSAPVCEYQAGKDKTLILVGQVVLRQGELVEKEIYIEKGVITRIENIGKLTSTKPDAARLICKNSFFSPGLVNAHEHTGYSYQFPIADMSHDYQHRLEWRAGGGSGCVGN